MLTIPVSTFAQKGKWRKALEINDIETYQEFLETYPKSKYYGDAMRELIKLEFEKSKEINTIEAYETFIEKYPECVYAKDARKLIENIDWTTAKRINTVDTYKSYIKNYPKGIYTDEAENLIEKIFLFETKNINTIDAYQKFNKIYHLSEYNDIILIELIAITESKEEIELPSGSYALTGSGELSEIKNSFALGQAHVFLIVAVKISNVKGEIKISSEDISVIDGKGMIHNPFYFEKLLNEYGKATLSCKYAITWNPIRISGTEILIFAVSVPENNNYVLSISNKTIGPLKVGTVNFLDLLVTPESKNKVNTGQLISSKLQKYLVD